MKLWHVLAAVEVVLSSLAPWRPAWTEPAESRFREQSLPVGGIRTKGAWSYWGGSMYFRDLAISPDGSALWAATSKGVVRIDVERERMTRYTTLDGLADTDTYSIQFGPSGELWVTTFSGLSRLDAQGWRSWRKSDGLPKPPLDQVAVTPKGDVWISTGGTLPHVVSSQNAFQWVTYSPAEDGLEGNGVDELHADAKGRVFASLYEAEHVPGRPAAPQRTKNILAVFQPNGTWRTIDLPLHLLALNNRRAIATLRSMPDGRLVAGTPLGLFTWDGQDWARVGKRDGFTEEPVIHLCSGPLGEIWGLTPSLVFRFDGTRVTTEATIPTSIRDLFNRNEKLAVGPNGDAWISLSRPTPALLHGKGSPWTLYAPDLDGPISSPGRGISTITRDSSGAWYFGAFGPPGGLTRFDQKEWKPVFYGESVFSAGVDKRNDLWIATGKILRHANGEWVDEAQRIGTTGAIYFVTPTPEGPVWFGGVNDLLEFDGTRVVRHHRDLPEIVPPFTVMAQGGSGHLWLRFEHGVAQWQGERRWMVKGKISGMPGLRGRSLAVGPRGDVYAGGPWGAARFDGLAWTHFTREGAEIPKAVPALTGSDIQAILVDQQGTVWFGSSDGGLASFNGKTWTRITTEDGLASNSVWSLAEDGNDLWVGTIAGLSRVKLR